MNEKTWALFIAQYAAETLFEVYFCQRRLRRWLSLRVTECCHLKVAKGGKLEPWNCEFLVHYFYNFCT